jgi:hypothetical protein
MLNELIAAAVDNTIDRKFGHLDGISNMLKEHERKNLLIKNLCREINGVQLHTNINLKKKNIRDIVESFTMMFANAALQEKERKIMSDRFKAVDEVMTTELKETRTKK